MRKGFKHTEESKHLMSLKGKGRRKSEEEKRKMSASHTGVPRSEDAKAKISAGKKLYTFSAEHRQHMLESARHTVTKTCTMCGKEYTGKKCSKYCSEECKKLNRNTPTAKIVGYDPVPAEEDICPKTGAGHRWVEVYSNSYVQVLKCVHCYRDSIAYFPRLQIQKLLDHYIDEEKES
jgi:hypothetical protein